MILKTLSGTDFSCHIGSQDNQPMTYYFVLGNMKIYNLHFLSSINSGMAGAFENLASWITMTRLSYKGNNILLLVAWRHKEPCHQQSLYWSSFPGVYCLNSLGPNDTIWRHKSRSTLAQVMACCLTAPSHYLNQCWRIIGKVQWHSSESNFTRDASTISHWN